VNSELARGVRPGRTMPSRMLFVLADARHWFKAGDWTTAVDNEDWRGWLGAINEGTEAVLGFSNAGLFHKTWTTGHRQRLTTLNW
jgi:hypothetical protein